MYDIPQRDSFCHAFCTLTIISYHCIYTLSLSLSLIWQLPLHLSSVGTCKKGLPRHVLLCKHLWLFCKEHSILTLEPSVMVSLQCKLISSLLSSGLHSFAIKILIVGQLNKTGDVPSMLRGKVGADRGDINTNEMNILFWTHRLPNLFLPRRKPCLHGTAQYSLSSHSLVWLLYEVI